MSALEENNLLGRDMVETVNRGEDAAGGADHDVFECCGRCGCWLRPPRRVDGILVLGEYAAMGCASISKTVVKERMDCDLIVALGNLKTTFKELVAMYS